MPISETSLGTIRRVVVCAYVGVFLWSIFAFGIPVDRIAVLLWMMGAFAASSVGRSRAEVKQMVRDWLILVAMYMAYDYSRGTADQWGIGVNYTLLRDVDRLLTFGHDPVLVMQRHFYVPNDVKWYDVVGAILYMTHFVIPVLPLVLLRMRNRGSWIQYVRRFSLTIGIAVFCFIVFPAAPPWMIAEKGYRSSVSRITGRGWWELHLKTVSKTLDRGAAVLNPVAAMPSLHAGLSLLAALWFARNARRWVRIVVLLYPVAMLTALVYFGEHFIIDGLMGWLVVLIAWRASAWWEQRPTQKSQLSN
jgi:hypothetical protein